jgi:hypothetical protein
MAYSDDDAATMASPVRRSTVTAHFVVDHRGGRT